MKMRWVSTVIVLIVIGFLTLATVQLEGTRVEQYSANVGELVDGVVVGQTFVAERDNLSSVSIKFATYSGRDNVGEVKFTLRRMDNLAEVVAESSVPVTALGDNQTYQFKFKPVGESKEETFLVLVEVPSGLPGKTVTVDVDNRDPYHRGSAYIFRGSSSTITADELAKGGKAKMDMSFSVAYKVPVYTAVVTKSVDAVRYLRETWGDARGTYAIWGRVALQSVLLIGISLAATLGVSSCSKQKKDNSLVWGWLAVIFVLGLIGRFLYAIELPLTNDEGNYLYDASTLLKGKLAGGDGYVKAPLVVLWIAIWEWLGGNHVIVGRMSSIVIGSITMWPVYIIARQLWDRKVGITAAALWALSGVTIVFNIYVHTQPLAIFFAVSGIAAVLMGVRFMNLSQVSGELRDSMQGKWWLFGAGILLGLGIVSRKSVLAVGLVPLLIVLFGINSRKNKMKCLWLIALGCGLIITVFLLVATAVYGQEGFWEAVGYNSAEDGISAVEESEREQVRAYSIRGMTPFFRESLALIMLSVLGLGIIGERLMVQLLRQRKWVQSPAWMMFAGQKMAWIVPIMVYSWAWSFFKEYEGTSMMVMGMQWLWWAMLAVIVFIAAWPEDESPTIVSPPKMDPSFSSQTPENIIAEDGKISLEDDLEKAEKKMIAGVEVWQITGWLLPIVWIGGLVFFYMNWIKFHANYIGEFLPPLVLIAGVAIPGVWFRLSRGWRGGGLINKVGSTILAVVFLGVLGWSLFTANFVTYLYEHTGTFKLRSLTEAADWAKQNIPPNETIFTGAAAVPFLSGHEVALDIAHPRWYAYGFTREDTERLNAFLPSVEQMLQAYREADWFLLEQQTRFSFLLEFAEIEAGLSTDWQRVHGIENGSNTMTFYKRIK